MFWEPPSFVVGDRIKLKPDPYTWGTKDQFGIVSEVTSTTYSVKWDDGTDAVFNKQTLETCCELMHSYSHLVHTDQCNHEWVLYKGFTKDYEFCKKCDIKRDIY